MASPRIEYAVLPAGDGPGQDRCFIADGLVVVLDGASAYDPSVSPEAGEYVDTLGPALVNQITRRPGIDLRDALASAISYAADKFALVPGRGPSSTVSIVRCGPKIVEVLVLGDSPVLVEADGSQREIFRQECMKEVAPELRERYRRRLLEGYGFDDTHRNIMKQIQQEEAGFRNQPDGFWIAEASPGAASRALYRSLASSEVLRCIVFTDGAMPLIDSRFADKEQILAELRALHRWEEEVDPHGSLRPRSKRHDDKTIALLSLQP